MLGFNVKTNDADLVKELELLAEDIRNPADAFQDVRSHLDFIVDQTFRDEGRGDTRWAPLAESTIRRKGSGKKILQDKSFLKQSFGGNIRGDILEYGSSRDYALYHQDGFEARDGSAVPARPPIILTDSDIEDILEYFIPDVLERP